MNYTNVTNHAYNAETIGEITISSLEFDPTNTRLTVRNKISDMFYEGVLSRTPDNMAPTITPFKNSFIIKLISDNKYRVHCSYVAVVTDIIQYEIISETGECVLTFDYYIIEVADVNTILSYIQLPSVVSHIFADGDFLGITIEGDAQVIISELNNYQCIRHGDKYYFMTTAAECNVAMVDNPTIDSRRYTIAVAIIAATTKVPSKIGLNEFKKAFEYFIQSVYNIKGLTLP